jgi:hypothetical protein
VTANDRQITLSREVGHCMGILYLLSCKRVPPIHHPIHLTREYRASLDLDPRVPLTSSVSTSSHQRNGLTFTVSDRIPHTSSFPFIFRPVQSVCSLCPEIHHPIYLVVSLFWRVNCPPSSLHLLSHLYQPTVGITVGHHVARLVVFGNLRVVYVMSTCPSAI